MVNDQQLGSSDTCIFELNHQHTDVLPPFQIVSRFDKSRYKIFAMYLDIMFI